MPGPLHVQAPGSTGRHRLSQRSGRDGCRGRDGPGEPGASRVRPSGPGGPDRVSLGPSQRLKIATLIGITAIGGYVDAVSCLGLGHVFTAAMTGKTVLLALAVREQEWSATADRRRRRVSYPSEYSRPSIQGEG